MDKEFAFTESRLKELKPPKKGRSYYRDTKEKGLSLYITATGNKTFFIRKRINGKDERVILGNSPDLKVIEARNELIKARSLIAKGENPHHEKSKIRGESTFKELFDKYINDYAKLHTKSWQQDIEDIDRNLKPWFNRKISSIKTEEIRKLHTDFGKNRGIYGANRLLDRINAIYNKSIEWGWDGKNPAKSITKFKMQSRDRFLKGDELKALFKSLANETNHTARDYILISLLTGARKGNVLRMKWKEIDFEAKQWRIPITKNNEPLIIPLSNQAIEILNNRKVDNQKLDYGNNEYVFLGTGKTGHLADPKRIWKRVKIEASLSIWQEDIDIAILIKKAKSDNKNPNNISFNSLYEKVTLLAKQESITLPIALMDVRLHDLRRTLGSWQAATGATTAIIGKSLGHKSQKATAIYERLDIDPVRAAVERATDAMFNTN